MPIVILHFNHDGSRLVIMLSVDKTNQLFAWDVATGRKIRPAGGWHWFVIEIYDCPSTPQTATKWEEVWYVDSGQMVAHYSGQNYGSSAESVGEID